jgi:predicted chitinase
MEKANYQEFANWIGDQNVMQGCEYVAANYPFTSAGYFWYSRGLNQLADNGATVEEITRVVNGPKLNGLEERQRYFEIALTIW